MKHTPGPWVKEQTNFNVYDSKGHQICNAGLEYRFHPTEANANAVLISASPDLLAACEEAIEVIGYLDSLSVQLSDKTWRILTKCSNQLEDAISKARGGKK